MTPSDPTRPTGTTTGIGHPAGQSAGTSPAGTNTGGFMNMAPTGKHFRFAAVLICTMRDGQIAHEKRIYDFTGFLLEIGVLKAKPI